MISLGMIGTSSIAHEFAAAAVASQAFQIKAVYSRTLFKAEKFGEAYGAQFFLTDLEEFAALPEIDVIYIASPNSLHFEQAMLAIENGKHLIVEKPIFSNTREWQQAFAAAEAKNVLIFEAARHIHEPNFTAVKKEVAKLEQVDGATLAYGKYSSRYDDVLAGEEPNIFSLQYSGGALADLGVYLVYAAVAWFGMPEEVHYFMKKVQTEVDGAGVAVLRYPYFVVTLHTSKIYNAQSVSEIYSGKKTITLDGVNLIGSIELTDTEVNRTVQLAEPQAGHFMADEVRDFARVLSDPEDEQNRKDYETWKQLSHDVTKVLEDLRRSAGLKFKADEVN